MGIRITNGDLAGYFACLGIITVQIERCGLVCERPAQKVGENETEMGAKNNLAGQRESGEL